MYQDTALLVHIAHLAVIVGSVEKLPYRGVHRSMRFKLFLDVKPLRHRIKPDVFAGEAGDVKLSAVVLLNIAPESGWDLDATLFVHLNAVVTSKHLLAPPNTSACPDAEIVQRPLYWEWHPLWATLVHKQPHLKVY